ncbi:MAG: family 1 glycosylhydrolase, partial [Candidatus Eremiobacterota bacterium]
DRFTRQRARVYGGHTGEHACQHYARYPEDIALMRQLGLGAYRFSLAWTRVLPGGTGRENPAGLDHYDRVVDALLENGLQPFPTLYHWDLPQALHERGGWANRDIRHWLTEYSLLCLKRLGDRVTHWCVLNEPGAFVYLGYGTGEHAPGLKQGLKLAGVAHNVNLAQASALRALKSQFGHCKFGCALNFAPTYPASDSPRDRGAAERHHALTNELFLAPLVRGAYPREVGFLPGGDDLRAPLDFLGVNLYFRQVVAHQPLANLISTRMVEGPGWKTDIGWEVWPEGMYRMLMRLQADYGLPMYVTENGCAVNELPDRRRIAYLEEHLAEVARARAEGADVRGYFCWSLLDNFEWAHGYSQRFGLVHVDFETQRRTLKDSAHWYAEQIRRGPPTTLRVR